MMSQPDKMTSKPGMQENGSRCASARALARKFPDHRFIFLFFCGHCAREDNDEHDTTETQETMETKLAIDV